MKKYLPIATVIIIMVVAFLSKDNLALANPVVAIPNSSCKTASATTTYTPMLLSAFANTKTLTCDAYNLDTYNTSGDLMKSAILSIQMTASTSASRLDYYIQYSKDGIDWFNEDTTGPAIYGLATVDHASTSVTHRWTPGDTNTNRKATTIVAPLRFVKVIFSGATATSTMWAEITPIKEVRY